MLDNLLSVDGALLLFGFIGAGGTFATALLKNPRPDDARQKRVWIGVMFFAFLAMAITCFSLVMTTYKTRLGKMVAAAEKKQEEQLRQHHDNVLAEIKTTVTTTMEEVNNTRDTVDLIYSELSAVGGWKNLAEPIAIPQLIGMDSEQAMEFFDKGQLETWERYRDWLFNTNAAGGNPALALSLGSEHYYMPGWILGWLLTTDATAPMIKKRNNPNTEGWGQKCEDNLKEVFAGGEFPDMYVKYVLFFRGERKSKELIAYADAAAFARELKIQLDLGACERVKEALNNRNPVEALEGIKALFGSVRTSVFPLGTVESVAQAMLAAAAPEGVLAGPDNEFYRVNIARLFKAGPPATP